MARPTPLRHGLTALALFCGACLLTACGTGTNAASAPKTTVTVTETTSPTPEPELTTPEADPSSPEPDPVTEDPDPAPETTAPRKPAAPKTDPRYRTCAEAKAHGLGPYESGVDPEYHWYIDRDHDGTVCE